MNDAHQICKHVRFFCKNIFCGLTWDIFFANLSYFKSMKSCKNIINTSKYLNLSILLPTYILFSEKCMKCKLFKWTDIFWACYLVDCLTSWIWCFLMVAFRLNIFGRTATYVLLCVSYYITSTYTWRQFTLI